MADPRAEKSTKTLAAMRSPSGADLVTLLLLILFGFGIWAGVEWAVTKLLRPWEPNEQKIFDAHGVTRQKAELTDLQSEVTEVQKYLNAARLEQVKQNAAVQSFLTTYPDLANPQPPPATVPPEIVRALTETRRQAQSASTVVSSLEQRLGALKQQQNALTSQVDMNTEQAKSQFESSNERYVFLKRVGTFVFTLAIVAGLFGFVRWVLWRLAAKRRMSTADGRFRPFVLAFGTLALLFAYDQFSFAGAALVGVLLLLFILRHIKWPKESKVTVK